MTSQTISPTPTKFHELIQAWQTRHTTQRFVRWLPRTLLLGLLIATAIALILRFGTGIETLWIGIICVAILIMTLIGSGLWLRMRREPLLHQARRFDQLFSLDERVATAIELINENIQSHPELAQRQIHDAIHSAEVVDYQRELPLTSSRRDWLLLLPFIAILAIILSLPTSATPPPVNLVDVALRDEIAQDLQDAIETVATDTNLDTEERESLIETLETSLDTIRDENSTQEESFASLNEVSSELQDAADSLNESLTNQNNVTNEVMQTLSTIFEGSAETLSEALGEIRESLPAATEEELSAMAEQLETAAEQAQAQNEALAQSLQQAATEMQARDTQAAQDALTDAQSQAQSQQQAQQSQQQSSENLQEAAEQAQKSQGQIAQASQPDEQSGQQDSPAGSQAQGAQTEDESGQPSSAQQGQQANPGGAEASASDQDSSEGGDADTDTLAAEGQGSESGGDSNASGNVDNFEGDGNVTQENNADGEGASDFEPIYAPRNIGGENTEEAIFLESDPSDQPVIEGDFIDNPEGEAQVPYDQVFQQYQETVNQALESDYVPLQLRDTVRDYFSSLEPGG